MRLSPAEAIIAATVNAAAVLGRSSTIGILEPGMQADLAIFDVADYREIPFYLGANLCTLTMKKGRVIHSARTPSVATVPRLPPQRADTAAGGVQRMSDPALRRQRS
jgi:cytosine/adenosine deaminase-related metal-dependent hydrolase